MTRNLHLFLLCALLLKFDAETEAACYFPPEFRGEYQIQNSNFKGEVKYGTLNITLNSIPIWGNCHRKVGTNSFLLVINYREQDCVRCLHLKLRSKNILHIYASGQGAISNCYINEKLAEMNCPSEEALQTRIAEEILLFKTKDSEGKLVSREYCPIEGKYYVSYKVNDQGLNSECDQFKSHLNSCPSGSSLNIHLHKCTFQNYDLKLDCMGQWDGPNGETYLALEDNRPERGFKPQYRCSLFKKDESTGIINLSISKDSTCNNQLSNSTHGYELLVLKPKGEIQWPLGVTQNECSFPEWMVGKWEHARIENNTFHYKDHSSFKTYAIKCVQQLDLEDKYLVFGVTQCDEQLYTCLKVQKKSHNIMEFQLGTNSSSNRNDYQLCSDENFVENNWVTQGRIDDKLQVPICPISGDYTGVIPNTGGLQCAKLWSDCRAPELMYYQVLDCHGAEIYEEREYKCLGHWKEDEYLYTYTQRHDLALGTFECFVGTIISDSEGIYIKEAGEHCQRGIDPLQHGMKLKKQNLYSCMSPVLQSSTNRSPNQPSLPLPTKPWKIKTSVPTVSADIRSNIVSVASSMNPTVPIFIASCILTAICQLHL